MKRLVSGAFAIALAMSSATAFAQDAVVEESTEAEAAAPASGWIVPAIIGVIIVCALVCDGSDPAPPLQPAS